MRYTTDDVTHLNIRLNQKESCKNQTKLFVIFFKNSINGQKIKRLKWGIGDNL